MTKDAETPDLHPRWHGAFIPQGHYHFLRNLLERYGALLTPGEYSRIEKKINKGKALLIERREDKPTAIYAVWVKSSEQWVYVVSAGGKLITALPPTKKLKRLHDAARAKAVRKPAELSKLSP